MVGADVHRIPLRRLAGAEEDEVLGQPERGVGREHIGAAGQIFLDDVVLGRALELGAARALLVGDRDVERHQPRRGRVDGHRRIHRVERDLIEQRPHVADMRDRHPDLADLAAGERMVAIETGLGRQVEGDREASLSLGQVLPIEPVGFARGRMPGIGAKDPGLVARRRPRRRRSFVRLRHDPLAQRRVRRRRAAAPKVLCMAQLQKIIPRRHIFGRGPGIGGPAKPCPSRSQRSAIALVVRTVASRPPTTRTIVR